jgi:predicted Zn-dependent protease
MLSHVNNLRRTAWVVGVAGALIVCLLAGLGCDGDLGQGEGPGHRSQALALTADEELQLGRHADAEVLQKYRSRIVTAGKRAEMVERVGRKIVRAAEIKPLQREVNLHFDESKMEWKFTLIDDRQVNAFCLPGGKVVVFSGLFAVAANEDELAAVLGHEIGHALAHHASERIYREQQQQLPLLSLHYDRAQETEADHIGLFLMTFAGYDPDECVKLWERMAASHQGDTPEILSDHPSDARRIAQMRGWVPQAKAGLQAFKAGRIAQ